MEAKVSGPHPDGHRGELAEPLNIQRLAEFEAAGIPMRERTTSGILHWKMMIFAGQNIVEFSGANYSSDAWLPATPKLYQNYIDEVITFTSDPDLVASFKTEVRRPLDQHDEVHGLPEHHRSADARLPDAHDRSAPELRPRPVAFLLVPRREYRREPSAIDVIMYRITDSRFTDEMIAAEARHPGAADDRAATVPRRAPASATRTTSISST